MNNMFLQQGNGIMNLVFLGGMVVVFYFFMIRPQQKKQKEQKNFRENLKKGDKVVTIGGIVAVVEQVKDHVVILEVSSNTTITVEKNAVAGAYASDSSKS